MNASASLWKSGTLKNGGTKWSGTGMGAGPPGMKKGTTRVSHRGPILGLTISIVVLVAALVLTIWRARRDPRDWRPKSAGGAFVVLPRTPWREMRDPDVTYVGDFLGVYSLPCGDRRDISPSSDGTLADADRGPEGRTAAIGRARRLHSRRVLAAIPSNIARAMRYTARPVSTSAARCSRRSRRK